MAQLRPQITRTLSILRGERGWHFTVEEGGVVYMESPLYETSDRCAQEGVKCLDIMHEEKPLLSDYIPTAADFMYVVKNEEKKE